MFSVTQSNYHFGFIKTLHCPNFHFYSAKLTYCLIYIDLHIHKLYTVFLYLYRHIHWPIVHCSHKLIHWPNGHCYTAKWTFSDSYRLTHSSNVHCHTAKLLSVNSPDKKLSTSTNHCQIGNMANSHHVSLCLTYHTYGKIHICPTSTPEAKLVY